MASLVSLSLIGQVARCSGGVESIYPEKTENGDPKVEKEYVEPVEMPNLLDLQKATNNQISVCLSVDQDGAFTHTKALESVSDPQNTILEYPLSQLFQKYGNRSHPLYVSGVKKDFRALLGKNGIERLQADIPQKLVHRTENIISDTKYDMEDTLRFSLIDPLLKDDFPYFLCDQLSEDGFKNFSDSNADALSQKFLEEGNTPRNNEEKSDYIYDIVVKKVPSGKAALALYRDGKLFMATYAYIGSSSRKTKLGQFKILSKEPYKRSRKYNNAAMPLSLNIGNGFYLHQRFPDFSHGCVGLPGVYADVLFSCVKDISSTDVFISENLYKTKK